METSITLENLMYLTAVILPLYLLFQLMSNRNKASRSPPRLPIIGHLHLLGKLPHRDLGRLSEKYGDMMWLQLGSRPTLVVSSAEAASQVMKIHDANFSSRPQWKFWTRILNNGKDLIASPYGAYWKNMRSICVTELLSNSRVKSFRSAREQEVNLAVADVERRVGTTSDIINMRQLFMSLANDMVSKVALGAKCKDHIDFKPFKDSSELAWRLSVGDFVPWLAWIDRLSGALSKLDKVTATIDRFFDGIIEQHSAANTATQLDEATNSRFFIDVLLQLHHQRGGRFSIDRDDIKGLLLDMFAAGTETSSTTMEWMMSEIMMNPPVMKRLQQETREAANGKQFIAEDDLKNMVYLKAVLQETLRFHSPTPLIPRVCIQDTCVNSHDVAAGTMVFINLWAIGRDPKHWEEPEKFIPDRFLSSSPGFKENEFRMIPFGYGRRACPGEAFSRLFMEMAIGNLLLKFNWELPFGAETELIGMKEHSALTTSRMAPLMAIASLRDVK